MDYSVELAPRDGAAACDICNHSYAANNRRQHFLSRRHRAAVLNTGLFCSLRCRWRQPHERVREPAHADDAMRAWAEAVASDVRLEARLAPEVSMCTVCGGKIIKPRPPA